MVWHLYHCDENYGTEVAKRAGVDLQKALALEPLQNRPAPREDRKLTMRGQREAMSENGARQTSPVGASAT